MNFNTKQFLCPCEENEMQVRNTTADIQFCPFCGTKVIEDTDESSLVIEDFDDMDGDYKKYIWDNEEWDDQSGGSF